MSKRRSPIGKSQPTDELTLGGGQRLQTGFSYSGEPPQLLLEKPPYKPEEVLGSLERAALESVLVWGSKVTRYLECDAETFRQNLIDGIAVARKALTGGDYGTAMGIIWNLSRHWGLAHGRAERVSEESRINGKKVRTVREARLDPANAAALVKYDQLLASGVDDRKARKQAIEAVPGSSREALKKQIQRRAKTAR